MSDVDKEEHRNPERELTRLFELGRSAEAPSGLWSRIERDARAGLHVSPGSHLFGRAPASPSRTHGFLRVAAALLGFSLFAAGAWSLDRTLHPAAVVVESEAPRLESVDELNRHLRESVPVLSGQAFPGGRAAFFSAVPELRLVGALATHSAVPSSEDKR